MNGIVIGALMIASVGAAAQDSAIQQTNPLTLSGYVEVYYSYDFNRPVPNLRPGFLYSYNRHNEFNLNLGFIKGSYATDRVRGNLAVAAGTYMNANYAAEPGTLKNVLEANAGYKLSAEGNLWFDIGIMPSHIGFESAVGKDNWTLTRSLVAENSPYFESGARLSYTTGNGKLQLAALALNGWQRITRVEGNSLMSWGTQVYFRTSDKLTLNYSTFIGTDKPDSARLWRYYHDLYGIFQFNDKMGITLGFDIGHEQQAKGSRKFNIWFAPVLVLRFTPNNKWAMAARGEYYSDEKGVIISTGTPNGFKTFGVSLNVDRKIDKTFLWRTELRTLNSKDAIFIRENRSTKGSTAITTSFAMSF